MRSMIDRLFAWFAILFLFRGVAVGTYRRVAVSFLLFSLVFVFVPAARSTVESANHDKGQTVASPWKKPVGKIRWLAFSLDAHRLEREMVIRHERIRRKQLEKSTGIYIALADLDDDGIQEIFAYMTIDGFCGAYGCAIGIYRRTGHKLASLLNESGFELDFLIDRKGRQKYWGILSTKTNGLHDIVTHGGKVTWKWNGKFY